MAVLHDLLDDAARRFPGAAAVRDRVESFDYAGLVDASRRVAAWLHDRGVRHGDRVVVRHPNAARLVAVLYAISRIGAVAVPLSPAMGRFQLRQVLEDAEPALVLTGTATDTGYPVVALDDAWKQAMDTPALGRPGRPPVTDDLALLVYTSGSTAAPKGVMSTHRQACFAVDAIARRLGYRCDDRVFCRPPLSFDYGLYQVFLSARAGSELQLVPDGNDSALLHLIRDWGATVVPVLPPLATMLLALAGRDRRPVRVRLFTSTGAALDHRTATALRARFPGARLCAMFGITECKRVSIMEPDGDVLRPGSVGRPLDGTRVLVVDEAGRILRPGETGELVVVGPHVMSGYWRAEDLSRQRFRPSPDGTGRALYTGDFGWMDADGYLYFTGRRDDIFKRKGVRTSTAEIEAAALDIPAVHAAAVPRPTGRELTVYVVADCDARTVLAGLRERLEPAKVPDACRVVPELPVTANGKVDKARLAAEGVPA